jgi:hypothetical protein
MNADTLLALITQSITETWPVASREAFLNTVLNRRAGPAAGASETPDEPLVQSGNKHPIIGWISNRLLPQLDPQQKLTLADLIDCPISVLSTPVFGAEALSIEGRGHIVVHQGTFTVLSFAVDMLVATSLTPKDWKPDVSAMRDYGEFVESVLTGLCYSYFLRPFSLPALRKFFPEDRRGDMYHLLLFAELFVLLHEYGHVRLGHVAGDGSVREMSFGSPAAHEQEKEADHYAVAHCPPFLRAGVLWGASMFLFLYGAFESAIGRQSGEHPCAEDRLVCLMQAFHGDLDAGTRASTNKIVEMLRSERATFSAFDGAIAPERRADIFLRGISPRRATWLLQRAMREIHG